MLHSIMRYFVSLAVIVLALLFMRPLPVVGQQAAPPAKAIAWQENALDAFVLAVDSKKPLVIVFLGPAAKNQRPNMSDRFIFELQRRELAAHADQAVFVRVRMVPAGEAGGDEYAQKMLNRLKLTAYPTVSIIAPTSKRLVECYRLEGLFPASEVAFHLNKRLPMALDPAVLRGESLPTAEAPAKSPQQALQELVAATQEANVSRLDRVLESDYARALGQRMDAANLLYAAKQRLLRALDAQFGSRADEIPQGDDCEELYAEMRQLIGAKVLSQRQEGQNVALEVELTSRGPGGDVARTETMLAIPDGGRWRLLPKTSAAGREKLSRQIAATQRFTEDLEQLADEVLAGKWAVRAVAKEMAAKHYQAAFAAVDEKLPVGTAPAK